MSITERLQSNLLYSVRDFRETVLVENSIPVTAIIYPQNNPEYVNLAENLARTLNSYCIQPVKKFSDKELLPKRNSRLNDSYRNRSLIVLGNITNNRVLLPMYARYYIFPDGEYPGGNGYDVRTIVNPYGTGENIILVGGSNLDGVKRGIEKLKRYILESYSNRNVSIPFIMEVGLDQHLKQRLKDYPLTPLSAEKSDSITGLNADTFRAIGDYGVMYGITADERYGEYARECLQIINRMERKSYGDRHYHIEKFLMAFYWLKAGGLLTPEEISRTETLLINTADGTQDSWWRRRDGSLPLGHRHHVKGTYGFLLLAKYLRDHVFTDDRRIEACDQWVAECYEYLDALCEAGLDDQDDETTLDTLAILFLYALGEERYSFFESGQAYRAALRSLALHDNMGAGAGQGGYGEAYLGAMYIQQNATTAVAASALYYQDGQLKWILENMPHLKEPLRDNIFNYCPAFMHNFDTGTSLKEKYPEKLVGIQRLPVTNHQFALSNSPPHHVEPMGHAVNAPETWQLADGIGLNNLPMKLGFDKITIRDSYDQKSPYLLLQGYQGGFNWQGHQHAANCIVRYSQYGHIFLIQNVRRQSSYCKNGLLVSNGKGNKPLAPIAAWEAIDDFDKIGITVTTLPEYNGSFWTRNIFWSKASDGFFVVIDEVNIREPDVYNIMCTWRTPGFAYLDGRRWISEQGEYRFELVSADTLLSYVEEEIGQGACNPFVLRQYKQGCFQSGESQIFQNLFYARPINANRNLDLIKVDDRSTLITDNGVPLAWCGSLKIDGFYVIGSIQLDGLAGWVSKNNITLTSGRALVWEDFYIKSDHPVGMSLDFESSTLQITFDNPETQSANIEVCQNSRITKFGLVKGASPIFLDTNITSAFASKVESVLADLRNQYLPNEVMVRRQSNQPDLLDSFWRFKDLGVMAKRKRDLRVTTNPAPLNGFPEQLVDTVIQEMRESWGQWPSDQEINIQISLPKPEFIDSIRILGDSLDDPILGKYSPLPDAIELAVELADENKKSIQLLFNTNSNYTRLKRFRGQGDLIETQEFPICQIIDRLSLKIPSQPQDNPLVLQEIEVYSAAKVSPRVTHFSKVELFNDGREQIIIITENRELIVIDQEGQELWRRTVPEEVTHLSCHDLLGNEQRYICLGLLGGELRILTPWGGLYKSIHLANQILSQDVFFGWVHSITEIQIWHRDADGRAALILGGYSLIVYLDLAFEILGHNWVDGPWIFDILTAPSDHLLAGDLWVRTGWNHGIFHYKNSVGMKPSGTKINFGGVDQDMFREFSEAIPFANGYSVFFDWVELTTERYILAAAENGIGILNSQNNEWIWKYLGITPISVCMPSPVDDHKEIITAGLDGFIRSYCLEDGEQMMRYQVGVPVTGLEYLTDRKLWVVFTHQGLLFLDATWKKIGNSSLNAKKMVTIGKNMIVALTNDGEIIGFKPKNNLGGDV